MSELQMVKVDDVTYAIDEAGNVLGPDADGRVGQLRLGVVEQIKEGRWRTDRGDGVEQAHDSRADGIRYLAAGGRS